jgi:hypothetical protein
MVTRLSGGIRLAGLTITTGPGEPPGSPPIIDGPPTGIAQTYDLPANVEAETSFAFAQATATIPDGYIASWKFQDTNSDVDLSGYLGIYDFGAFYVTQAGIDAGFPANSIGANLGYWMIAVDNEGNESEPRIIEFNVVEVDPFTGDPDGYLFIDNFNGSTNSFPTHIPDLGSSNPWENPGPPCRLDSGGLNYGLSENPNMQVASFFMPSGFDALAIDYNLSNRFGTTSTYGHTVGLTDSGTTGVVPTSFYVRRGAEDDTLYLNIPGSGEIAIGNLPADTSYRLLRIVFVSDAVGVYIQDPADGLWQFLASREAPGALGSIIGLSPMLWLTSTADDKDSGRIPATYAYWVVYWGNAPE